MKTIPSHHTAGTVLQPRPTGEAAGRTCPAGHGHQLPQHCLSAAVAGLCLAPATGCACGETPAAALCRTALPGAVVLLLKTLCSGGEPLFSVDLHCLEMTASRTDCWKASVLRPDLGAVAVVAALGFATPFTGLLAALAWLRVPRGFIEVTLFAWRYLFVLADDAQVIHAAQRNRLGYVGVRRSFRSFGTLAGALVIKAFDSSQTMTTAMMQRGYDGTLPLMKHKPFRHGSGASGLFLILMAAIWTI